MALAWYDDYTLEDWENFSVDQWEEFLIMAEVSSSSSNSSSSSSHSSSSSGSDDHWQERFELFTYNDRGQATTHTDPEGNVTAYVRFPENDPEGDGQFVSNTLSAKQYGRLKELHVDVDPLDVMTLVGQDGDLEDFTLSELTPRFNTPGIYQDLTTRYGAATTGGAGCSTCSGSGPGASGGGGAYDALGNPLSVTDPRGFTTTYDYDEMGRVYRTTSPAPYEYKTELFYDDNGNIIRTDVEDKVVDYQSDDPTDAFYAKFIPSGNTLGGASTAHVPTTMGDGGLFGDNVPGNHQDCECSGTSGGGGHSGGRKGWFSSFSQYDLLDRKKLDDIDATTPGSFDATRLITHYAYDPNGNLIQTTRPLGNTIEYDYDERNLRIAQRIANQVGDPLPEYPGAVTIFTFDKNGNLLNTIGPSDRVPDAQQTSLSVTLLDAFRSADALTHRGSWLSENTYDGFDRLIATTDAIGNVTANTYDPDGRVIESSSYGPIGGTSPTNREGTNNVLLAQSITRYDEAGRAYEQQQNVFLAEGATIPSGRSITYTPGGLATNSTANDHTETVDLTADEGSYLLTRTEYDRAGRVIASYQDNTHASVITYDGASRQLTVTDALGNRTENTYDANGNVILTTRIEKCTIQTVEGQTIPDEIFRGAMRYDCLNRLVVQSVQGADGSLQTELDFTDPDKTMFTLIGYDSRGNRTLTIDPKANTVETVFDGASRPIETLQHMRQLGQGVNPPAANRTLTSTGESGGAVSTRTVYDLNSNVVALIDDHGNTTTYQYDTQDRQVIMIFPDGSSRTTIYDEASDVLQYIDENGAIFDYHYDAMGRRTSTVITPAPGTSQSPGLAGLGDVATDYHQTVAQHFEYDGLSRITMSQNIAEVVGDSSSESDPVVAECVYVYDSLSRALEEAQTLDPGSSGGEGSPVTRYATNHAYFSAVIAGVTYPNGRQIENTYDALYRRTQVADTPSDSSSSSSSESSEESLGYIAQWEFFGDRIAETRLGNGITCTFMNNSRTHSAVQSPGNALPGWGDASSDRLGYDGAGRMIAKRYIPSAISGGGGYADTTPVVGFTTRFDKSSNKFFERALHAENRSFLYIPANEQGQPLEGVGGIPGAGIDSMNRLLQYQRGNLAMGGGSVVTPLTLPGADASRTYDLDHLGNWKKSIYEPIPEPPTPESSSSSSSSASSEDILPHAYDLRNHNALNQITRRKVASGGGGWDVFAYDLNGNLLDDGERLMAYDALNRLVQVARKSDGAVIGRYLYDAGNRRVQKVVANGGLSGDIPNSTSQYCYFAGTWQDTEEFFASEESEESPQPFKQFIWGTYIDELTQLTLLQPAGPQELPLGAYYPLQDLLYRTVCVTDAPAESSSSNSESIGQIVEAYDYDAYGNTVIFSESGAGENWWGSDVRHGAFVANDVLWCGYRYSGEEKLYAVRRRIYAPTTAIWLQRDPEGFLPDANLYLYSSGNPVVKIDPLGLSPCDISGQKRVGGDFTINLLAVKWMARYRFDVSYKTNERNKPQCKRSKQDTYASFDYSWNLKQASKAFIKVDGSVASQNSRWDISLKLSTYVIDGFDFGIQGTGRISGEEEFFAWMGACCKCVYAKVSGEIELSEQMHAGTAVAVLALLAAAGLSFTAAAAGTSGAGGTAVVGFIGPASNAARVAASAALASAIGMQIE